jgi:NAD(P)H dehydrogenase (quinone)
MQVSETLQPDVLEQMNAPLKSKVPVISPKQLPEADGFVFGFPTKFGMMCAQFKAFMDSTGGLWQQRKLVGKPAGLFTSSGTQCGGQETTL